MVDGWGNATAPTSSALLLSRWLYSSVTRRIKGRFRRSVQRFVAPLSARDSTIGRLYIPP
jgi:hypothetical protein